MKRMSEQSKMKEGRGTGEGADYKPWIEIRELHNQGTAVLMPDWKTGRQVHLLSKGEEIAYNTLRWDDSVLDIREQFPLDLGETTQIAEELNVRHPSNGRVHMTTDLLVTINTDGVKSYKAYSIKSSYAEVYEVSPDARIQRRRDRTVEKLTIESTYWESRGVPFEVRFKDKMNEVLSENVRFVTKYYNASDVHSQFDLTKHLIARKLLRVDMENRYLMDDIQKIKEFCFDGHIDVMEEIRKNGYLELDI